MFLFKFDKPENIIANMFVIFAMFSLILFSIGYAIDSEQLRTFAQINFLGWFGITSVLLIFAMIYVGVSNSVKDIRKFLGRNRTKNK